MQCTLVVLSFCSFFHYIVAVAAYQIIIMTKNYELEDSCAEKRYYSKTSRHWRTAGQFLNYHIVIHNCGNHAPEINTEYQFISPENTFVKMLQDYFHEKIFRKNPRGQEKGVAWWHFCEINFHDKANKHEIQKIFYHKISGIR